MARKQSASHFFFAPLFAALAMIVVLSGLVLGGWPVHLFRRSGPAPKLGADSTRYAGWKEVCDVQSKACFLHPADWYAAPYGGFQNPARTAYANLYVNTKDRGADAVYVAGIYYPQRTGQGVVIVGFVHGIVPSYALYDDSAVHGLRAGEQAQLVVANPVFTAGDGGPDVTFVATPGAAGLSAITTIDQAKAWFGTSEAETDLKIMQSFYYRE
ncbi:MAG TPA: hypothetical protein VF466_00990 [Candidatus Saccharimonadales bacterium]